MNTKRTELHGPVRITVNLVDCTFEFVLSLFDHVTSLNTDFGKYFLFIYLINGSNSLTFLSSKLLTLRFITLLLTVSNNTKHQFHIFVEIFEFLREYFL